MKTFKQRLKFYIIGFGLGIIAVAFIFGQRGCAWLPGNQVKNTIAQNELIYGDSIKAVMECNKISNSTIYDLLNSTGDVDFSESNTNVSPKEYVFYGEDDAKFKFALYETYSELIDVNASQCDVSVSNEHKQTIALPQSIVSSIIESHAFKYYETAECQIPCYNLTPEKVQAFHKTANINMAKSNAWPAKTTVGEEYVNKIYYLEGSIDNVPYGIVYEIGENRTRIKFIDGGKECDC
jgi:hypothetical protein